MNQCIYCTDHLAAFQAFCDASCEGLFGIAETNECTSCMESYRLVGYTRDGRPIMGCPVCGEHHDVPAQEVAA